MIKYNANKILWYNYNKNIIISAIALSLKTSIGLGNFYSNN